MLLFFSFLLPPQGVMRSTPTARLPTAAKRCPARWPWSTTSSSSRAKSKSLGSRPLMPAVCLLYPDLMPPPSPLPQVVLPRRRRQLRERSHPAQVPLPVPPHPGHVRGQTQPGPAHRGHREAGRQQDGAFKDPSFV